MSYIATPLIFERSFYWYNFCLNWISSSRVMFFFLFVHVTRPCYVHITIMKHETTTWHGERKKSRITSYLQKAFASKAAAAGGVGSPAFPPMMDIE